MSKLVLDICAEVGVPNSIVCPHHIFYFTVLIRSSTSVDRCLNAMFPLSWPRSSKEMTAMFSFGHVLLEIITGKRAVLSDEPDEPDEDDETLVSWVSRFYPESYPLNELYFVCLTFSEVQLSYGAALCRSLVCLLNFFTLCRSGCRRFHGAPLPSSSSVPRARS